MENDNSKDQKSSGVDYSRICINERGQLSEWVSFDGEIIEVKFNCLREHILYGICFAFNPKFESRKKGN